MKIGIFTECYTPVMNGVVVSILSFKNALEQRGHEVFIFAPENKDAKIEHGVYRFPSYTDKKERLYPIFVPSLALEKSYLPEDMIKSLDVIHSQHMFTAGRLARFAARKFNKPLVYTYHTLIDEYAHYAGVLAPITKAYLRNMSKRFCNTCDQVIVPSGVIKNTLRKYGVTAPIDVIMTGIDPKAYKRLSEREDRQIREQYKIPADVKILLYLSRIAKEKNIDLLLKSFIKIKKQYPQCHLLIVGGGPEEAWLQNKITEYRIQNTVTATGMLPKEEANKIFGLADIITFPSHTETQGIVIIEAMAAGTPPVAVNRMGPTEIIHDGEDGYLVKNNVADFSEHVLKLLTDDKLRDKFATEGLCRVEEFSNETSTLKLISLYEKVIEKKRSLGL
jgi:1,2-diacylglycerol 3-alpha-glucosyltransferase